ncbi:RNA polymerase subunit sigma-24 [Longispora fulva]|uniref:SigE family RNA polymerase sigma factor n=1 Tax=Longispora fulva TaxID=619741 RepID=UPI0018C92B22|nr:SigE family RNA polymerase sigma factor [Longispora fulva]GIG56908.1 RNA polymerase subunit sigma-24 [Longispora fulva]
MRFEEFVDNRLDALLRYAVVLTGDPHLAQDVVQETMVRAQLKWRRISNADRPEPYVKRMLTNVYLDWRRGPWWRRVLLRGDDTPDPPVPTDHAQAAVERDAMWLLLAGLPRRQRAAVVLRYYEGLPDAEIADVLGCAVGTVRAHISRALATLRTQLRPVTVGGEQ